MSVLTGTLLLLALGGCSAIEPRSTQTAAPYINLFDNLDERNDVGYCLDLKGWGDSVEFVDVQLHSCKDTGDDVNFAIGEGSDGRRVMGAGDADGHCLRAQSATAGSGVDAPVCDARDPLQEIAYCTDGTLRLNAGELCLVAADVSENAGPVWMMRSLTFENCDDTPDDLKTWAYRAVGSTKRIVAGTERCGSSGRGSGRSSRRGDGGAGTQPTVIVFDLSSFPWPWISGLVVVLWAVLTCHIAYRRCCQRKIKYATVSCDSEEFDETEAEPIELDSDNGGI